jgi:hypothetical protein
MDQEFFAQIDWRLNTVPPTGNSQSPLWWRQHEPLCEWDFLSLGRRGARNGSLYNPADVHFANRFFNANCGPAAFAAVTRRSICSVMRCFPKFPRKPWTTRADMESALKKMSTEWSPVESDLPRRGLALIQLIGPWNRLRNPCAALTRTHWVGVYDDYLYDVNWDGWLPRFIWQQLIYPSLEERYRGACGWRPLAGFEFLTECIDRNVW